MAGSWPRPAVGRAVFDPPGAKEWHARGEEVVLVRKETNPDDLAGMIASNGILTARGGKTSHAAVVARGMGKTCVCGAESLDIDLTAREIRLKDGTTVSEGDVLSIDGPRGAVYLGDVPVRPSEAVPSFEGELAPAASRALTPAVPPPPRPRDRLRSPPAAARAADAGARGWPPGARPRRRGPRPRCSCRPRAFARRPVGSG